MLAYFAREIEEREVLHPVVVVDHFCGVRSVRIEIEETGQLFFYSVLVVAQGSFVQKITLVGFSRRVADHSGGSAYEHERLMPAFLKVLEHHYRHQMADM